MNNKSTIRFLPLLFALALVACKPQAAATDPAADQEALQSAAEKWESSFNAKDADAVAAIYTEEGQLLPPGGSVVNGKAAIRDFWANDIGTAWAKLTIKTESSGISGDWAWRAGPWTAESTPVMTGKYVEIWKRSAEGWKLHRDIWNNDAPPAPAEVPAAPATPGA